MKTGCFGKWLKDNLGRILFYFFVPIIYLFINLLYGYDTDQVYYGSLIYIFLAICLLIVDFLKYKKKYIHLTNMVDDIENINIEDLNTDEALEQKYFEIIEELRDMNTQLSRDFKLREVELKDYYNLWVHQIKTPIAATKLLLEDNNDRIAMKKEVFKIEQYVEMALQYVRLESMYSDLELKECDLRSMVSQVVKKYSINFIGRDLSLNFEEFDVKVVTDEKWLSFVIEQILSNAVKYTMLGTITISADEDKKWLLITDTGIGIKQEDLPRVFEKGFTGYNGRMDKKSTGIGLYLCKQIMNKLENKIWLESEEGKGTTVFLDLDRIVFQKED